VALTFRKVNFDTSKQEIKRERNSVLEDLAVLQSVCQLLQHNIAEGFLSLKTQEILS
jgi:hypothetical protein